MKVLFKNPLKYGLQDVDHGDPFIYRWQGKYYLFTTGADKNIQGYLYSSDNLIDFNYLGQFSKDESFKGAFAPEIIYAFNKFYLCSSPLGRGHHIGVSDSITGPYKDISGNVEHLIDGSFILDKHNKLHFLHATIHGISLCDINEFGEISNEKTIIEDMGAWTEGPSIIERDGLFYLFYCGNHYMAKGYRVNYAVSDKLEGPYVKGINNPLLIDTNGHFTRIGHSCEVLSPDLFSTQIVYHSKPNLDSNRVIFMNKLHFDGYFVSTSHVDYEHSDFNSPSFASYDLSNLDKNGDFYLSKIATKKEFAIEGHINKNSQFVFSYKNENNYYYIKANDKYIEVRHHLKNKELTIFKFDNAFDFNKLHSFRIVKESAYSLYLDNIFLTRIDIDLPSGKVGYITHDDEDVNYIAFTNKKEIKDTVHLPTTCKLLKDNDCYTLDYEQAKKQELFLSLYGSIMEDSVIDINGTTFSLMKNDQRYYESFIPLGKIVLPRRGKLIIKIISGKVHFSLLKALITKAYEEVNDFSFDGLSYHPHRTHDSYLLKGNDSFPSLKLTFSLKEKKPYESFGILMNVTNFSKETFQCRYHFCGLMIELRGSFFSIHDVNYERVVLTDRKVNLEFNKPNTLKVLYEKGFLRCYLNDTLISNIFINSINTFGQYGLYSSPLSDVKLNLERLDNNEKE